MNGSRPAGSRVALWIIGFLFGWPFVSALGLGVAFLVVTTDVGVAVAATVQGLFVTAAGWYLGLFAVHRGAAREIWIPVLVGSLYPALISAAIGLGGFEAYRLMQLETYLLVAGIALTALGPAIAVYLSARQVMAAGVQLESGPFGT
ncbi:MAG: hypothetical protein Q8K99_06970 [Actinomycetota bacterium]|nr:hypothetical protein [Actinomycetota bacterium]